MEDDLRVLYVLEGRAFWQANAGDLFTMYQKAILKSQKRSS